MQHFREHEQQQLLPNVVPDPIPEVGDRNGRPGRMTAKPRLPSANTVRQRAVKSLDESAKRLKAIEVSGKTMIILEGRIQLNFKK
jgi:hypothetical protein